MPMNYKDYSPEWKNISKNIIQNRGKNKCELCFAPNNTFVYRSHKNYEHWFARTWYFHGLKGKCRKIKIVLTVHHIDGCTKNDNSLNLLSLCQRCHLRLDLEKHIRNRKTKKVKGQLELGVLNEMS